MVLLLLSLLVYNAHANLNWFGFRTSNGGQAESSADIEITVWYDNRIYQCTVQPTEIDKEYGCYANAFTLLHSFNCALPEYKMMISNKYSADAVHVDSFIIEDNFWTWWSSDSWCIPDSEASAGYWNSQHLWKVDDDACPTGHTNFNKLCIDNEGKNDPNGCWPEEQIIWFDKSKNGISYAVSWQNGDGIPLVPNSCSPTSAPTSAPTLNPTSDPTSDPTTIPPLIPTMYPTSVPTSDPTSIPMPTPTTNPTTNPTLMPSTIPSTSPTTQPTLIPTMNPIECDDDSNAVLRVSFHYAVNDGMSSQESIVDNLHDKTETFVNTDVDDKTICNVESYQIFISLDMESSYAVVNASICFDCAQLFVNYTETDLKADFIQSLNKDNQILTVTFVDSISFDVISSITTTTTQYMLDTTENVDAHDEQTKKEAWIGSQQSLFLVLLIIILILLLVIICLGVYLLRKKKKSKKDTDRNLVQMSSTSQSNMMATDENTQKKTVDDEELYGHSPVPGAPLTRRGSNSSDGDVSGMYEKADVAQMTEGGTTEL